MTSAIDALHWKISDDSKLLDLDGMFWIVVFLISVFNYQFLVGKLERGGLSEEALNSLIQSNIEKSDQIKDQLKDLISLLSNGQVSHFLNYLILYLCILAMPSMWKVIQQIYRN